MSIKEIFEGYLKQVYGDRPLGHEQRDQIKLAFYAGCFSIHELYTVGVTSLSDKEGVKVIDDIEREIKEFQAALKKKHDAKQDFKTSN